MENRPLANSLYVQELCATVRGANVTTIRTRASSAYAGKPLIAEEPRDGAV